MPPRIVRVFLTVLLLCAVPSGAASAADNFDGPWQARLSCTASRFNPGKFPQYTIEFPVTVKGGKLSGRRVTGARPGYEDYTGEIQAARATIRGQGQWERDGGVQSWDTSFVGKFINNNSIAFTGQMQQLIPSLGRQETVRDCRILLTRSRPIETAAPAVVAARSDKSERKSAPATAETPRLQAPVPAPIGNQPPPAREAGHRVALVIGNSAYQSVAPLPNPKQDASDVASALRGLQFKVTFETDLTRERLFDALRSFAAEAEKADWALVYFAGHGMEIGGVNYLIPVEARLATDRDAEFEAVALDKVITAVDGAKRLRLVLLDACRDNPFATQIRRTNATRSIGRGLAQIEPDAGTLVVYAAKHGQVALDGDRNSPFVSAFVRRLATPNVEVRRLFDLVRDDVLAATNRRQQPYSYGSLPGNEDFFFAIR